MNWMTMGLETEFTIFLAIIGWILMVGAGIFSIWFTICAVACAIDSSKWRKKEKENAERSESIS